jgi:hypothetical protein
MGFRIGQRTKGNIFIIKTVIDKYVGRKRGEVYWMLSHLQKAFDMVVKEAV